VKSAGQETSRSRDSIENPTKPSNFLPKTMVNCAYCHCSSKRREDFSDLCVVKEQKYKDGNAVTLDDVLGTYVLCNACCDDACATMDKQLVNLEGAEYWMETQEFWEWLLQPKEEQLAELKDEVEEIKEALENIRKRKPLETDSEAEEDDQPPKKKARTTPPAKDGETVIDLSADG
jgi:hypothetical protein